MTEGEIRSRVAAAAAAWLGKQEADGSHREIVDVYNTIRPLPRQYTLSYGDAWCACFVSALGARLGISHILLPECSCNQMIALYQKADRWVEGDGFIPQVGDLLLYDWQDNGFGDNRGEADHIGIVEKVAGETVTVVEGNYQNAVARREIKADGRFIRGWCTPDYKSLSGRGDTVKEVQLWLNLQFDARLQRDGSYGPKTKTALTKALQKALGVTADGIYGPKTAAAVRKNQLCRGSRGVLVQVLQGFLVCNGYRDAYMDGIFGSGTEMALMAYQKKKALAADGIAGKDTFKALCT